MLNIVGVETPWNPPSCSLCVLQITAIILCLSLGLENYWKKPAVEMTIDDFNRVKYQPKPSLTWPLTPQPQTLSSPAFREGFSPKSSSNYTQGHQRPLTREQSMRKLVHETIVQLGETLWGASLVLLFFYHRALDGIKDGFECSSSFFCHFKCSFHGSFHWRFCFSFVFISKWPQLGASASVHLLSITALVVSSIYVDISSWTSQTFLEFCNRKVDRLSVRKWKVSVCVGIENSGVR